MKRIIILLMISNSLFSQEKINNTVDKHEIKGNILLVAVVIDISYEYLLNSKSTIGMSFTYPYKKREKIIYIATPYYRYYTGKKYAYGFFVEGFGMLISERKLERLTEGTTTYKENTPKTYAGIGAGIGGKFLFKNNIVAEINIGLAGASRDDVAFLDLIPRAGISIGKRF